MNKQRLLKLAKHLESGKLGHKVFDFNIINSNKSSNGYELLRSPNTCGTHGCAIGELPIVFPKIFNFSISGVIGRKKRKCSIEDFFDIDESQYFHLFGPYLQVSEWIPEGLTSGHFGKSATRENVAKNIRWFVKNNGFRGKS